jgi:hypothetical protein
MSERESLASHFHLLPPNERGHHSDCPQNDNPVYG